MEAPFKIWMLKKSIFAGQNCGTLAVLSELKFHTFPNLSVDITGYAMLGSICSLTVGVPSCRNPRAETVDQALSVCLQVDPLLMASGLEDPLASTTEVL